MKSPIESDNPNHRIDKELLMRPDPILFYEEIILYEDELADHGMAQCSVKLV